MFEVLVYVGLGLVIVVLEIRCRLAKIKVERLENLWVQVLDLGSSEVVLDHSLKMFEEMSKLCPPEFLFKGIILKIYRKGEGD